MSRPRVSLLTGGDDRSYALGLTGALTRAGVFVEFVGSDALDARELRENPRVAFLNLRGEQRTDVSVFRKATRVFTYYVRLIVYVARRRPRGLLHILWNNKVEWFDRTLLMGWYRILGHKVVMTVHNVNAARRDGRDSLANTITLRAQYRLSNHLFVHTAKMKQELVDEFNVAPAKVSVIPFGLNDTTPRTGLSRATARARLGLVSNAKVALFFGQIAPYKGLEYLIAALPTVADRYPEFALIIAGKIKRGSEGYWSSIEATVARSPFSHAVVMRIGHVPDEEVETYFEAADVLALPYVSIFQSGVPFLAYSFGLPVVATDVGSLAQDVQDGRTGYVCRPADPASLAGALDTFFASDLYRDAAFHRESIAHLARAKYSWDEVGRITVAAYDCLAKPIRP